ncbi:hydro-lyase, Fe-S type, tartrate/fumarate subfamily, beta region [Spirochaetia bacterium]|nr:hydro-lyase, Fe-S type, tartrate/fumarate subfamily, beta region [Spirochaetia bacterium]
MIHHIDLPLTREKAKTLTAGDTVYLSGTLYTARDAAHKRLMELLDAGKPLPFPVEDSVVYYVGPTPASPGQVIGSAGPTTSYRMDAYTPRLLGLGLRGMIGKGKRSLEVIEAIKQAGAVYLGAIGGTGALLADCIKAAEVIAFDDLGPEAIRRLRVAEFPVTVVIDCAGNNLYVSGREAYLRVIPAPTPGSTFHTP